MNLQIALILGQDGITNGAIYALLALSILLVFTVTRVLLIPQGEFVAWGALTMSFVQAGKPSGLVWLLAGLAVVECLLDLRAALVAPGRFRLPRAVPLRLAYAASVVALVHTLPLATLPLALQVLVTLAIVVPFGPQMYRIFYQPIAHASVLVLLIVAVALHVAMVGVGLLVYGPEGSRTRPFSEGGLELGPVQLHAQTLWVIAASVLLVVALALFFGRSVYGKALRAAAMNRIGARLMGISPPFAGTFAFFLASLIGALSGVLISPITTIYYDSGFLISLKGFVGSIIGGLASYPVAALGAVLVGMIEAFSAFYASAYKEVIVFTLLIPVLLWRSLTSRHVEEEAPE